MKETYSSFNNEALFVLIQNNDERAYLELYNRTFEKLYINANVLLSSHQDAEEIIHDIYVNIWNKRENIHINHTVETYLKSAVHYGCLKKLAERKRNRAYISGIEYSDETEYVRDNSTEQFLNFEFLQQTLENAIITLPQKCQIIFRLSREYGFTDKEIAQKLGVSVNTIRTQMARALKKLKYFMKMIIFF
ncbi:RNA polymerase sigma factor [Rhizosphaericola mali]|uniref:Sigma-70 family RNA polymerase sigma factor n=1 Tax=Rhizosphaericola mali TaxID=2545455 RepID=A0A5P2G4C2_9BACT|nr:sigma-70 family RNA polymerase sigma factor [Rhizosphaericola mali]QES88672.1 sigma-70 family RNA polymerase sigma factor [Rhizosphaericola mali]